MPQGLAWYLCEVCRAAHTRYCLLLLGDVAIVEVSPGICRAHRTGQTAAEWVGAPHPAGPPPRTERRGCAPTRPHPPASASAAAAHCACMPPCPCQRTYQQEPQALRCAAVSGAGWDRGAHTGGSPDSRAHTRSHSRATSRSCAHAVEPVACLLQSTQASDDSLQEWQTPVCSFWGKADEWVALQRLSLGNRPAHQCQPSEQLGETAGCWRTV